MGRLIKFLVVIVGLCAAVCFGMRALLGPDWMLRRAEKRFSRLTDFDVKIGSYKLTLCGASQMKNVKGFLPGTEIEVFSASEVLFPSVFCDEVQIRRPCITVVQGKAGEWQPAALQSVRVAINDDFRVVDFFSKLSSEIPFKGPFSVSMATVVCKNSDGKESPVFGGLSWSRGKVDLGWDGEFTVQSVRFLAREGKSEDPDKQSKFLWLERPGMMPAVITDGCMYSVRHSSCLKNVANKILEPDSASTNAVDIADSVKEEIK